MMRVIRLVLCRSDLRVLFLQHSNMMAEYNVNMALVS